MNVILNGEVRQIGEGTTVAALIEGLGRSPKGLAIAINEDVVHRGAWCDVELRAGDRVEILTAAQGG
ncbi:MAG TPA: sulfur carrier protein ThiS [Acidimicrobiia bacterium]